LGEMYDLINFITNKDFSGNIVTPDRFNALIKVVNLDLFRNKYGLPEEYQPGRPIPKEYVEITLKNMDDMKAFKVYLPNVTLANGVLLYPADYAHRDEVIYNFTINIDKVATVLPRGVEILRESQLSTRMGNFTKRPNTRMPVGVVRQDGIHIFPYKYSKYTPDFITTVDFSYYRWPINPEFSYTLGDGYITYEPTKSIEPEWPEDEHITLVRMILEYLGVNLREEEVVNYAETKLREG